MDALRLSWACHLSYGKLYQLWSEFKTSINSKSPESFTKLELFLDAFKTSFDELNAMTTASYGYVCLSGEID